MKINHLLAYVVLSGLGGLVNGAPVAVAPTDNRKLSYVPSKRPSNCVKAAAEENSCTLGDVGPKPDGTVTTRCY